MEGSEGKQTLDTKTFHGTRTHAIRKAGAQDTGLRKLRFPPVNQRNKRVSCVRAVWARRLSRRWLLEIQCGDVIHHRPISDCGGSLKIVMVSDEEVHSVLHLS